MARLPQPGGDNGNWGEILNDFLAQSHTVDGSLKDDVVTSDAIAPDAVNATSIANGSITEPLLSSEVQAKLNATTGAPSWDDITGKPAVIAAGVDQATARNALGVRSIDEQEWSMRSVRGNGSLPARRTNYRIKANTGSPQLTEDTGQSVGFTTPNTGLSIINGRLTFAPAGGAAGYRTFSEATAITRLGARFVFNATGGKTSFGGSVCLSIYNEPLDNFALPTFRIGIHLVITPEYISVQKFNSATSTFTTLSERKFSRRLAIDNLTEYAAEIYHAVGSSAAYIISPDGHRIDVVDADIATWAGNYGFIECYTNSGTEVVGGFTESWADTGAQDVPSPNPAVEFEVGREIAFAEIVTTPTLSASPGAGAAIAGLSISLPWTGQPVMLEADLGLLHSTTSGSQIFGIYNSAGALFKSVDVVTIGGVYQDITIPTIRVRLFPGASADTYSIRAWGGGGTATMNSNTGQQAYIRAVAS